MPTLATQPVLDGKLDEEAWSSAMKFEEFKTFKPDFGKEASQKTTAYLTYDAENLYFAFRAYDTEPTKVKVSMSRRDAIDSDDTVFFILDTFDDAQSAYTFILNPYGIQEDGMLDSQGKLDISMDFICSSKGQVDD